MEEINTKSRDACYVSDDGYHLVTVAEFRRLYDAVLSLCGNLSSCVTDSERHHWLAMAESRWAEIISTDCKRASGSDWYWREKAQQRCIELIFDVRDQLGIVPGSALRVVK